MIELTTQQLSDLMVLKRTSRKSYADLAESEFGDRSLAVTLRSMLRRYSKVTLPEPEPRLIAPVLTTPINSALVIADLHVPYQNSALLQRAIDMALAAGIQEVDIAGDLHDFNSLSPLNKGEPTTVLETDLRHSRQILTVLAHHFNKVRINAGNHDEYWVKKKGGTFQDLIYNEVLLGQLSNQIEVTNYDYMLRGDNWVIGHLSSYDEQAGRLAAKISDLMDRNVAVGHDHIRGSMYGEKGYLGISIGAMLTPDRFWYKQRRLNTFPPFQLGFLLLIDGEPYHFSDDVLTKGVDEWKKQVIVK